MKGIYLSLLAVLLVSFVGCFKTPSEIKISPPKVEIYEQGGNVTLKTTVLDKKGKPIDKVKLEYASENNSIASVDATGKVTAQMSGETNINISTKKITKTIPVIVRIVETLKMDFPISGIYEAQGPEKSVFALNVMAKNESGQDLDLSLLKFKSSDEKIATVNQKGELTLLSDGKVIISAEIGKKKASLDIPVTILRPSAIKVDSANFSINAGETEYLPFTVISTKGTTLIDFPVKIEFDKEGIASANEHGQVTGLSKGAVKATITAGDQTNSLTLHVK